MAARLKSLMRRMALPLACLLILGTYAGMIDLKGISTDEGIRMWIINGGRPFIQDQSLADATWQEVLAANSPFAYQPLYFLLLNTLMRVAQTQQVLFFRAINIFFLWVCLQGLITLSKDWRLPPRLFLLGLFSFNAYLFMHVLQIREYIVGVAFYIWSTWLVLRLDNRPLERPWTDVAWFTAYGILLTLGFFVQSWVVFPAIAQGLFLVARRRNAPLRFYAHLALSYAIVLSVTRPYLEYHRQKVAIGRWGTAGTPLWPQLSDGFHLIMGGHLAERSSLGDGLAWFWSALLVGVAGLFFTWSRRSTSAESHATYLRQGWLMLLCLVVSLALQIGYFLKVDTLSVWPRYFIIHYFFVTWLIALGFKLLHEASTHPTVPPHRQRHLKVTIALISAVTVFAAAGQIVSYYRDPLLDTGFTRESDWRIISAELARQLEPRDGVLTRDFIQRSTLTFTRRIPHPVLIMEELTDRDLSAMNRILYVEPASNQAERATLAATMATRGFPTMQVIELDTPRPTTVTPDWRLVAFHRR